MRLWVRMKDNHSFTLLIPKKHPAYIQLIGFHLTLPMGYIDIYAFFCAITEMSKDMDYSNIMWQYSVSPHTLETAAATWAVNNTGTLMPTEDTRWDALTPYQQATALAVGYVYLNYFIFVLQGGIYEIQ